MSSHFYDIKVHVIDIGISNLSSLLNALRRVGVDCEVIDDYKLLGQSCDAIILPGVGSYCKGIRRLKDNRLDEALKKLSEEQKIPILGICLGMQLLFDGSDEQGKCSGLGLIPGWVRKIDYTHIKVPNMGWCNIKWSDATTVLKNMNKQNENYYFVHSYWAECDNESDVIATSEVGFSMTAVVEHENIFGVQFHPEKSLDSGMDLLSRFFIYVKAKKDGSSPLK